MAGFSHLAAERGNRLKLQLSECTKKSRDVQLIHVSENKHLAMENKKIRVRVTVRVSVTGFS